MDPITVIIVDDHSIVRAGVRMILEDDEQIEVVGEAGEINAAIQLIRELTPSLILLDIDLGNVSTLDHLTEITAACPSSRILMFTGLISQEVNARALSGGAHGLVLKTSAAADTITAVKKVAAGELWFDRSLTASVLRAANANNQIKTDAQFRIKDITPRELMIIELVAEGRVNKDIGQRLGITEKTVRNALTVVYSKLGVSNRLELAIFASRNDLDRKL